MNDSRSKFPRSISFSLNSHSPVSSGFDSASTFKAVKRVINEKACAVGINSRCSRTIYLWRINSSIIEALVAGVPSPFSIIASANSSSSTRLPACSIALSSVASVYRAGGLVALESTVISLIFTDSPSATGTKCPVSSFCCSRPYTESQPGLTSTLPSVLKGCPSTLVIRVVTRNSAEG